MFEQCNDLSALNEERINLIRGGHPSVVVNKEYARRKASLLCAQERGFNRIPFYPVPLPEVQKHAGILNADWSNEDPYTLVVTE